MFRLASLAAAVLAAGLGLAAPTADAAIAPKLATAQSAEDVTGAVKDLYVRYFEATMAIVNSPDGQMPPEFEWKHIADLYFTTDLAARFKKAVQSDEPVVDWDFLADGQDVGDLKVISATGTSAGNEAKVVMKTSNYGNVSTTNVLLTKTADGWRIKDFQFWADTPDTTTLTAVLKQAGF